MARLEPLGAGHAAAVLDFETENRAYFSRFISDRGDDFFERYDERFEALLADQGAGGGAYYVLVDDDGSVLGRFNLVFTGPGTASLGYRVAERVAGRGVATATVRELCGIARSRHRLRRLRATTSLTNVASQHVLRGAGFVAVGPADPREVGGKAGTAFERGLTARWSGVRWRRGRLGRGG